MDLDPALAERREDLFAEQRQLLRPCRRRRANGERAAFEPHGPRALGDAAAHRDLPLAIGDGRRVDLGGEAKIALLTKDLPEREERCGAPLLHHHTSTGSSITA